MEMTGRSVGQDYKYGMNGQMKESAVFEGFMSADLWGYDARLGRRWEVDPITYPWQSPYATFNNNPIYYSDPSGLEGEGDDKKAPGSDKKRTRTPSSEEYNKRKDKGNKEDSGKDHDIY